MTQIEDIRLMNETTIRYLQYQHIDSSRNVIIQNMLLDPACFFKLSKEDAYIVLQDVGIAPEKLESIYQDLIAKNIFYSLVHSGQLDIHDPDIHVQYPAYDPHTLFPNSAKPSNHTTTIVESKPSIFQKWIQLFKNFWHHT